MSMLLLGKRDEPTAEWAANFLSKKITDLKIIMVSRGDPVSPILENWSGDYLVSYLYPYVIEKNLLHRISKAAINFHPGPPEYPGIGCTNFALYDEQNTFGVTCHHMAPQVDTGKIIEVRRFPITADETVYTLTQKSYKNIKELFLEVMNCLLQETELPTSEEHWSRKPFTRKELNELCEITPDMSEREIKRRVRALTFPGAPGPFIELFGCRFNYEGPSF